MQLGISCRTARRSYSLSRVAGTEMLLTATVFNGSCSYFHQWSDLYCVTQSCRKAIGISGRKVDDFLRALNVLFTEQGTPHHIFIDAESALVSVLKDGLNLTHDNLWRNTESILQQ